MYNTIRYTLVVAAAALAFSSCSRESLLPGAEDDDSVKYAVAMSGSSEVFLCKSGALVSEDGGVSVPMSIQVEDGIGFGGASVKGAMYSSVEEMRKGGITSFTVGAWDDAYAEFIPNGTTVKYSGGMWKSELKKEWAPAGSTKTFLAYANLDPATASVSNSCTAGGTIQTLTYGVPTNARQQNDIMLGWYNGNGGGTNTATITMVHPLTALVFKLGEIAGLQAIRSISVSGVYSDGTATLTYTAGQNAPAITWGATDTRTGSKSLILMPEGEATSLEIDADNVIGEPFIILPQDAENRPLIINVVVTLDGNDVTLIAKISEGTLAEGKSNVFTLGWYDRSEVHFVDLGLPSGNLWADRNIGSADEYHEGALFSWGNTKGYFGSGTATFTDMDDMISLLSGGFKPANYTGTLGNALTTDIPQDPQYDAARLRIGSDARIPSNTEWQELLDNTTIAWDDTHKGYTFTHKTNPKNYIFLPHAGFGLKGGGYLIPQNNILTRYWTSTYSGTSGDGNKYGYALEFHKTRQPQIAGPTDLQGQYHGFVIRAVKSPAPKPELLSGRFSVSADEYIQFSRGNLYATRTGTEGNYEYSYGFESNQYDYRSRPGYSCSYKGTTTTSDNESGMFSWCCKNNVRTSDNWGAFDNATNSGGSASDTLDWGGVFGEESPWYTFSSKEFNYLMKSRRNASQLYKSSTVCGVSGVVLAPDGYTGEIASSYTLLSWNLAEQDGLVFLPYVGLYVSSSGISYMQDGGYYFLRDASSTNSAQGTLTGKTMSVATAKVQARTRATALPVRLVRKFRKPVAEPKFIDLGLSVLWADVNLGATDVISYGDYYAYGELEPYYEDGYAQEEPITHWRTMTTGAGNTDISAGYSWKTYSKGGSTSFVEWNDKPYDPSTFQLLPEYDAAAKAFTGAHIPSSDEWTELNTNCKWTWTNGYEGSDVQGYIVTSNIEGYTQNFIFLPAAGAIGGKSHTNLGERAQYRTNTRQTANAQYTDCLYMYENYHKCGYACSRYTGALIRPVKSK